jgi:hypothetical protein
MTWLTAVHWAGGHHPGSQISDQCVGCHVCDPNYFDLPQRVACAAMTMFNFRPQAHRPFLDTLFLGAVVIVAMAFAAVVLHYATSGLWLLVHNVLGHA